MTIEQLLCFLSIEKNMNFSIAADELCISQSSLSKHIKSLENELSVLLFNRNTRNISLTLAGNEFSIHSRKIIDEYKKMTSALKKYSVKKKHSISITSIPVLNQYGITDAITAFITNHPDVDMYIIEKDTSYVVRSIENVNTEVAIIRDKYIPQGKFKIFPLVEDELVLVTGKNHPFAERDCISLAEAADENFILLGGDTCLYNTCIEECTKVGFVPVTVYSNIKVETIRNFVSHGMGVSLMMRKIAEYLADPDIRIVKLIEKPVQNLSIVVRDEQLTSVCSEFITFVVDYFEKDNA
ncbi:MAG: LysR family transcriptional regulator [Ruminiclostridium sp.]